MAQRVNAAGTVEQPWYRDLTGYHWFVVAVASMGWMFDTMAQQLFNLARVPAMRALIGAQTGNAASAASVSEQAGYATMFFMIGWAMGGVIFGILGDRIGRARTMVLTILGYSVFTGLSVLSRNVTEFNVFRFVCGLGVGGQFGVGVTLVAETVSARARPYALGIVQALSTVGNMTAALTGIVLGHMEQIGTIHDSWRYMFLAGAAPAPLALVVFKWLREPESWLQARTAKKKMGSFGELFADPRWKRNSIIGMLLAFSGVVGLWGIGFFSFDLLRPILERTFRAQGMPAAAIAGRTTTWIGISSLLQNAGAFLGVNAFTWLTSRVGRKKAFAVSYVAAMGMTAFTFWRLNSISDIFWMIPLMGFTQLALFGGFAIYLPELFPTQLRSTGTSFCYNVGRFVAAAGPYSLGLLTSRVYSNHPDPMRYAGVTVSLVFLVGLFTLPFAPETKGQPLPE